MPKNKTCGECRYYDAPFCDYHAMKVASTRKSFKQKQPRGKMSNRICKKCRSGKVVEFGYYGGTTYYRCDTCHHLGEKDEFPEMTLFDRITASPEVLAPYCISTKPSINGDTIYYYSTVTSSIYLTESEAITATVKKLKEVEK